MRNTFSKQEPVTDVITHDVTPLTVNTDAGAYSKLGWIIIVFGFFGFLLWAFTAPLDRGVPLSGTVLKEGNRKAIQHLTGGTVQDILVKDGDLVKKGQLLVRMNNVLADSQVETTRAQYFSARASEARLVAERDGLKQIVFPPALAPYKDDPRVQAAISLQEQLLLSRRSSLQSELGGIEENMAGLRIQMKWRCIFSGTRSSGLATERISKSSPRARSAVPA